MSQPSVLIAGAGPAGLILAFFLRKSGVPVRIIDKERMHRIGSRGAGIMPRTLEMYATLGVLDDILAGAGTMVPTAVYDPGELVPKAMVPLITYQEPTPNVPHVRINDMD
ncbi:FAD binding domain-containing protein [Mycena maculata]|uniref:FAD binding domain-containing protein n=1 Tax=Mycena maculata TaxID=230809 RepID=A0AAD7K550_9AGAR|nr:FAD binding domain-containing protein [Mycena maculata]